MHNPRYTLSFDGTIGEFVKLMRKHKKINSKDLSLKIGKSNAYISHLENNRYKNLDYNVLYKIFLELGIEDKRIEDYLAHFGYISPERLESEAMFVKRQIEILEDPNYQEHELQRNIELAEQYEEEKRLGFATPEFKSEMSAKDIEKLEEDLAWYDLLEESAKKEAKDIYTELMFFLERNIDTFPEVLKNLHSLVSSMKTDLDNYKLFTNIFRYDISSISSEGKEAIVKLIKNEARKAWERNH